MERGSRGTPGSHGARTCERPLVLATWSRWHRLLPPHQHPSPNRTDRSWLKPLDCWSGHLSGSRLVEIVDVLTNMAKTGRLGPVFSGADWNDVTAALGEPWDIGTMSRNRKWPRLFAYGDLELSVCRCRKVSLISVQTWRDVVELPPSVVGGTGTFPAGLRHTDIVSALDKAGCSREPCPPQTFGRMSPRATYSAEDPPPPGFGSPVIARQSLSSWSSQPTTPVPAPRTGR